MLKKILILWCFLLCSRGQLVAQQYILQGNVTNANLEPMSFVTVQIKDLQIGTKTDEKGHYEFKLEEGQYEIVFSLIGYKKQRIKFVHQKNSAPENVILEESAHNMNEVKIVSFRKDKAEELIRTVIRQKNNITTAFNSYTSEVYIRATEENESVMSKRQKAKLTDSAKAVLDAKLPDMNMSEIYLQVDFEYPDKIKEKRTGVNIRGKKSGLFFLTTTDGDFNLYNNLIKIPALSETPMLSPISYSGLVAYRYKTKNISKNDKYTIYTIHFSPGRLGNALIEGDVKIVDTSWAIISSNFTFPSYHMPEYDYFEVRQENDFVEDKAYLPVRQEFIYRSKSGRSTSSGRTIAVYDHYKIDTQFSKKYFNREISSTTLEAYKKDSTFWNTVRKEPLNENEVKFIIKSDSVYRATHSQHYLDSIDHRTNKITALKILFLGQDNYKRKTERTISFYPVISMFRPFLPYGTRLNLGAAYYKIFESKKFISLKGDINYGFLNHDIMGSLAITHRYNPFSNGYITANVGREFEIIFFGDAFINLFRRSNFYIKNHIELEHGLEIANGLVLRNKVEFAERQSLDPSKLSRQFDYLLKDTLTKFDNEPLVFAPYNAFTASVTLEYTPFSMYIREPRQKIILGSKYPTFYVKWKKGFPDIFKSDIDYDYLEFGLFQKLKLGLAGISNYQISSGEFLSQKRLKAVDYKYISRGNPYLFNNPLLSFQALDSTFPIFRRFYEGHYIHHFNGSILNKIPLIKKLKLLEVAGGGVLYIPKSNLKYAEAFVGIEKIIPLFREKFKLGAYYVVSAANKANNPMQLKFGFDIFDKRKNSWD